MVIHDPENAACEIYEIKHSSKPVQNQYRHLLNAEYTLLTERIFGRIRRRAVIYKGAPHKEVNGIEYINAEQYLNGL